MPEEDVEGEEAPNVRGKDETKTEVVLEKAGKQTK